MAPELLEELELLEALEVALLDEELLESTGAEVSISSPSPKMLPIGAASSFPQMSTSSVVGDFEASSKLSFFMGDSSGKLSWFFLT